MVPGGGAASGGAGTSTPSGPAKVEQRTSGVPVVTTKAIKVGVLYASAGTEVIQAVGGSGSRGDERKQYEILVADLNKRGGIFGRKIELVFHMTDFGDSRPKEAQEAPACERFTNDDPVFAVLTSKAGGSSDAFKQCLERAGIVHLGANFTTADTSTYQRFPHFVEPSGLAIERGAGAFTGSLQAQTYFRGWNPATGSPASTAAKVGILTIDYPTFTSAVDKVLVPSLKRAGVNVAQIARITSTSDPTAQMSNAVLRFRQSGVTHVMFFASGGNYPLLFLTQADGQAYRPRYGFTSQDVVPLLHETGVMPERQLTGSVGMGWWPSADVTYGKDTYANRAAPKRCRDVLRKGGEDPQTGLGTTLAYIHCDLVWYLEKVLKLGGRSVSRASFLGGVAKVGRSFEPGFTIASYTTSSRHNGVAQYRNFAYGTSCECFTHVGPARNIP